MNMGKSPLLSSSLLFLIPFILSIDALNSSSCPIDFGYVERLPWNSSQCHQPMDQNCCTTLRSLLGIGLAQYLKDTSMFYLPTVEASSSCLSDLQARLTAMSMSPGLVSLCWNNTDEFAANPSGCAGIITIEDWVEKVGSSSPLDSFCNGDLTGLRCASCLDAGMRVNSQLLAQAPNSTKCFYYTILYAAGIVNDLGPLDTRASSCIVALPLVRSDESDHISRETLFQIVFGLLGAVVGVAIAIGAIFMYRNWSKKRKQNASHQDYISGVKARVLPNSGAKWFQVGELEQATNGFSQRNFIGQGGNGIVYKGVLSDGTVIAVKEIRELDSKGDEEFANEVEIISNIRHRNLLSLRGCCATSDAFRGKRRYFVYDFMSNGSLDDHLFNHHGRQLLTWPQRKNIILDVAKGLAYLHYGLKPAIYHRDIKATNILLDTEMKARVADFGLAKQSTEGQSHLTTRVAGTYGYLAPEYALYGQLTEKSDVYSFGIVILEVMSGRKVLDTSSPSTLLITDWAWSLVKSGNVKDFFDESIRDLGPKGVMERFVVCGILCAHVMVALRPTIADALKMLEGDIDIPRLPDRPLPLSHESFRSSLLHSLSMSETFNGSSSISIV